MKRLILAAAFALTALAGCSREADVVSKNLSNAADDFTIHRRIVFYNGITGGYMLEIDGLCALGNNDSPKELSVTCKVGPNAYKKHFLGLSDNVTYFVEQVDAAGTSPYHYTVMFAPSTIVPDVQVR